mmetsp:Transcript_44985/g.101212  ORF Transcript_44985/g.101212 Transcript_44985/m.101212 type:complete len:153 (-) Transcript_44985:174-632(-)
MPHTKSAKAAQAARARNAEQQAASSRSSGPGDPGQAPRPVSLEAVRRGEAPPAEYIQQEREQLRATQREIDEAMRACREVATVLLQARKKTRDLVTENSCLVGVLANSPQPSAYADLLRETQRSLDASARLLRPLGPELVHVLGIEDDGADQ